MTGGVPSLRFGAILLLSAADAAFITSSPQLHALPPQCATSSAPLMVASMNPNDGNGDSVPKLDPRTARSQLRAKVQGFGRALGDGFRDLQLAKA